MTIRPLKSDADHAAALREIEVLWGAPADCDAGDRLDVLATLVDAYERNRWPIAPLDPVAAIEAAMATNGYTRAELAKLIGQPRATEILARRRALTLPMIRKIAREWHVPERILIQPYALAGKPSRPASRRLSQAS